MLRTVRSAIGLLSLWLAIPAHAIIQPAPAPEGEVLPAAVQTVELATGGAAAALNLRPGWVGFRSRHGDWKAQWNRSTGSPHRAFGPPIRLASAPKSGEQVDRLVRAFVAANPGVFGQPTLETATVQKLNRVWYVRYRQTLNGIPVLFTDWEFRVSESGRLFLFGADAHTPPALPRIQPVLVRAAAREQARAGLAYRPGRDVVEDGGLHFLPWRTPTGVEYRLVYEQKVVTEDPPGNWLTYVDAASGDVLWRMNRVRHVIGGRVTGAIHPYLPTDPLSSGAFQNLKVFVGPETTVTNATGDYGASPGGTVTVTDSLIGLFCDVDNVLPSIAVFSTMATDPSTVDIHWNDLNSDPAERDVYFHTEIAHQFIKTLDPGFTTIDYPMPARVNINATCNAFWNGTGINFYRAGGGCPNTATMPDVVYHEYGHGINDMQYIQAGSIGGMFSGALHEGLADVTSAFIQDDPVIGKGFFGPATSLRTIDNTRRWPENASGDPHVTGLIIAGAFWDLREAIGLPLANQLVHFARYGIPDDADDGVAMSEYFVETLLVDDDDANLANGTPHFNEIVTAFNAHGIGTGFFVDYGHTPLTDQAVSSDYPVTAVIQFTGPVGALDPSSPQLHYSINGAAYVATPMNPAGPPDQFTASIPGQPAAIIRYYFSASDIYGASSTDPPVAPTRSTYQFLAGPASTVFTQTMEADPGWTVGSPADNATSGIWERGNPNGTLVNGVNAQPENDHTQGSGTLCWFTGQHPLGEPNVGFNDVDGGMTTLTSNTFDALTGTNYPVIEYYRWYSNQLGGSPLSDNWRSYVSNDDGTTWVLVENTAQGESDWVRILFFIDDYVTPTTTMKLRFVAQDSAGGSLVEAGIDDVRLLTYPLALAVGEPAIPRPELALAPASPNPMQGRTVLRFTLPARGRATLGVYDLHGRAVRNLIDRELQAGPHAEEWDGLDARGRRVPNGPYFIKLEHGGEVAVRKVVRVE